MMLTTAPLVRPPVLVAGLVVLSAGLAQLVAWPAAPPEVRHPLHPARAHVGCPRPAARPVAIFGPPPSPRWNGIHCVGNRCVVSRDFLEATLHDQGRLATTGRIVPSVGDGKPNGFRLYAIHAGSYLDRLGFRNGDRIQRINGCDLSTPDDCLELYTKVRSSTHFTVELERGGRMIQLAYRIL